MMFELQDALKKMRLIDDRIIHALNTKLPTQSGQIRDKVDIGGECKRIYEEVS